MQNFFNVQSFIILFVIISMLFLIWYLISFIRDTSVKIELSKYPLGLPKGTIRALLTLLVVGASLIIIATQGSNAPESIQGILLAVTAFYFGQRTGDIGPNGKE